MKLIISVLSFVIFLINISFAQQIAFFQQNTFVPTLKHPQDLDKEEPFLCLEIIFNEDQGLLTFLLISRAASI